MAPSALTTTAPTGVVDAQNASQASSRARAQASSSAPVTSETVVMYLLGVCGRRTKTHRASYGHKVPWATSPLWAARMGVRRTVPRYRRVVVKLSGEALAGSGS